LTAPQGINRDKSDERANNNAAERAREKCEAHCRSLNIHWSFTIFMPTQPNILGNTDARHTTLSREGKRVKLGCLARGDEIRSTHAD
jgi:hypothetical protein